MSFVETIGAELERFDRILLFSGSKSETLLQAFGESDAWRENGKKILILSTSNAAGSLGEKQEYRRISKEEQEILISLHHMYDFSDRFRILSDTAQYGSLLNYVKTGIMTIDEVFQAMLA